MISSLSRAGGLVGLALVVSTGCADDSLNPDGGVSRDATIADAPFDAILYGDGAVDAAGRDAAVTACTTGTCDPREPTSSCGAGEVCALEDGIPGCVQEIGVGDGLEGTTCEVSSDCAPGLACFRRRDGGECALVCCPDEAAGCGAEMRCTAATIVDGTATDWWSCIGPRPCDVFDPSDKCEPFEACYIVSADGATDCLTEGNADVGDPCTDQNDCRAGLFCGGLLGSTTCSRICGMTVGPRCPPAEGDCVAYAHSPPGTGICTAGSMSAR